MTNKALFKLLAASAYFGAAIGSAVGRVMATNKGPTEADRERMQAAVERRARRNAKRAKGAER